MPKGDARRSSHSRLGRSTRQMLAWSEEHTGIDMRPALRKVRGRLPGRARADASGPVAPTVARDIKQLKIEVGQLKAAVQELRALGGRVAELTDLVTELLIVVAKHDDPDFQRLVARYLEGV